MYPRTAHHRSLDAPGLVSASSTCGASSTLLLIRDEATSHMAIDDLGLWIYAARAPLAQR